MAAQLGVFLHEKNEQLEAQQHDLLKRLEAQSSELAQKCAQYEDLLRQSTRSREVSGCPVHRGFAFYLHCVICNHGHCRRCELLSVLSLPIQRTCACFIRLPAFSPQTGWTNRLTT